MKKIIVRIFIFVIILFFISDEILYDYKNNYDYFLDIGSLLKIKFIKNGKLFIKNLIKKEKTKIIDVEFVKDEIDKKNGLKYRSFLKEKNGVLFFLKKKEEYKYIFDTKNLRIPLDIIYINKYNTVVYIEKFVSPMREINYIYYDVKMIKYILAINSGLSDKWGIKENLTKVSIEKE